MPDRDSDPDDSVRDAIERSRSGAPAAGRVIRDRFSSNEIFQRIIAAADEEITADSRELFFSGLAAGFAISITFLLYVSLTASTDGHSVLSVLLYPLGFIYIIIGGYQLFTENTLPPVALTIERLASVPALLRNWVVVLAGNFLGGLGGAAALAFGGVLSSDATGVALDIAQKGIDTGPGVLFVKAAFAGLIVAGVVWVEYAARDTVSRIVVVYLAFLAIPLGNLFHVVVSFTEMMYLVFAGSVAVGTGMVEFVLPVLAGNTAGGVVLVTVVNYFQTSEERLESARFEGARRQLSWREWLFGGLAGRSYVPLVEDETEYTDEDPFRIVVPIADPDVSTGIGDLAGGLAASKASAVVELVLVVPEYDPHSRPIDTEHATTDADAAAMLADVRTAVESHGVRCDVSSAVARRPFRAVFTGPATTADLLVMKQGEDSTWASGVADRRLAELAGRLPCDVLVFRDRGFDPGRVLVPVLDTPHGTLSAEVARQLLSQFDTRVTLLHVVDGPDRRAHGEQFLNNWAIDHDLEDADRLVDDSGDLPTAFTDAAADHTLVIVGARERGLISRLLDDSLHLEVVSEIDQSVLLAERPTGGGLRTRLFGES
ncbi:formate/nitrite transporter family protein [Halococcoides cellulosivorans]|uniref:Formate transporter n=1 Tax=Halococcoides cellulosivorans TaxID=1679096 RepID=A0A2R4WY23_9EURY|nr:formate/nitrite transporter family protein [Halococcoides cellulosivorans]AWB26445.1 formate transporter [Halococcoides cellulosivorans]